MALEIVQKYDYKLPNISNKLLNERIKIIAQKAGIKGSEELFFDHIDKSKAYTITRERHECICSHTGRNTFVTMLSLRGWHYHEIGRYTGHKKIETIQHYDKSKVGTKYRVMFEALQKERPELLLKLVIDKVDKKEELNNKETTKEPLNLLTNPLLNDNEKVELEYYAIDRDIDITKFDLTNDELKWLDKTEDTFQVGIASLKTRKILNRLILMGIVVRLK